MPNNDFSRMVEVKFNKKKYPLVLTAGAMIEIAERYGGLNQLVEKLTNSGDDIANVFNDLVWVFCLLANQGIARQNFISGTDAPLLTEEEVMFASPIELLVLRDPIMQAMTLGLNRNVEGDEKNVPSGQMKKR